VVPDNDRQDTSLRNLKYQNRKGDQKNG